MATSKLTSRKRPWNQFMPLLFSVIVGIIINISLVTLLKNIYLADKPLYTCTLFSINPPVAPYSTGCGIFITKRIIKRAITLNPSPGFKTPHTTYSTFPHPPIIENLSRPPQHFHENHLNCNDCPICHPLGQISFGTPTSSFDHFLR